MNIIRKSGFCSLNIILVFILSQARTAKAITTDDLADICQARESAILDISVEYQWGVEPHSTIEDITGKGYSLVKGTTKRTWSTKRPFGERYLSVERTTVFNEDESSFDSIIMQSYNGEIAKYANITDLSPQGVKRILSHGSITKSKRFIPQPNQTPIAFSILRLSCVEKNKVPLSERLRQKELVRFNGNVEKINGFNAVHVDLLMDNPVTMRKQLNMRVYFSVDHGYTPIKYDYISVREIGPEISYSVDVNSLEEVSEGLWFPNAGSLKLLEKNLSNTYRATNIIINQGLTDEHFNMEFPPGTKVKDEIEGVTYVIQPSEQQFNDWLEYESAIAQTVKTNEKIAANLTDRTATAGSRTEIQQINPTWNEQNQPPLAVKDSKNNIIIYLSGGIVCFILVILFLVRKRISNQVSQ